MPTYIREKISLKTHTTLLQKHFSSPRFPYAPATMRIVVLLSIFVSALLNAAVADPASGNFSIAYAPGTCKFHTMIKQYCDGATQKTNFTVYNMKDASGSLIPGLFGAINQNVEVIHGLNSFHIGMRMKWYEWLEFCGPERGWEWREKMTYEYLNCQWDENVRKENAKCGAWCNRGGWTFGDLQCGKRFLPTPDKVYRVSSIRVPWRERTDALTDSRYGLLVQLPCYDG